MKDFLNSINNPTEAQRLGNVAFRNIEALADLILRGDHTAKRELLTLAHAATDELTSFCESNPAMFRPLARQQFSWPVLHSLHHDQVKENDAMLKNLQLAADTGINISGKSGKRGRRRTFSFETPANIIAIELHFVACALKQAPMDDWEPVDWIKLAWTSHVSEDDPTYLCPLETWGQAGPGRAPSSRYADGLPLHSG